ncbi:MAG: GNAT family N-acetyltransferase [Christensenellales bacterium]
MVIRPEQAQEFPAIYELVKTAFETAKVKDGDEQDYVNSFRAGGGYIPQLALVAVDNDIIIGHMMLTQLPVACTAGGCSALFLSPLCVALPHRSMGVGGALIHDGISRAREMGYTAVFLVGDPAYYSRFGFAPSSSFGIVNVNGIPDQNVMVLELSRGALHGVCGTVSLM